MRQDAIKYSIVEIFSLIICLALCSCATIKIVKQDNNSILAVSAKSSGLGSQGYGIEITLVNINTQQKLVSKSFSSISPHSVIQNIPPGQYYIKQISVPVGNITYISWSDSIRTFFGEIEIKPNSKYYLGDFSGTREVGKKNVLRLRIKNENIPNEVIEKIEAENTGWKNGDFVKLYPYKTSDLLVY